MLFKNYSYYPGAFNEGFYWHWVSHESLLTRTAPALARGWSDPGRRDSRLQPPSAEALCGRLDEDPWLG